MRKPFRLFIGVSLLLVLTGGQWAVLQSAAWAGMLIGHMRSDSLPHAVSTTLDGKHPCCLCRAIASGKASERKSDSAVKEQTQRIEFVTVGQSDVLGQVAISDADHPEVGVMLTITPTPPLTPPPRATRV